MQVSSQTNSYQDLNVQQKSTTIQPVPQEEKKLSNTDVSPEKRLETENKIDDKQTVLADKSQEEKDQLRSTMVDRIEHQSKKTQVEIYLSVATDSNVELAGNSTVDSLKTLRDVQKQNNTVEAYATYQENQKESITSQLGV